jgi:ferredoxin, 2Fe-2S
MPRIVFIERGGRRREVDAPAGISLMEAAKQHGIIGIVAQCGGACACATCHVYIDPVWFARLAPREEMEEGMLESAWEPRANSRLSCQITLAAALDGLTVTVPRAARPEGRVPAPPAPRSFENREQILGVDLQTRAHQDFLDRSRRARRAPWFPFSSPRASAGCRRGAPIARHERARWHD